MLILDAMSKGNPVHITTKTDLTKLIIVCLRRIFKTSSNELDQAAVQKGADMIQIMDCLKKRFTLHIEPNVDLLKQLKLSAKHAERHGDIVRITGDDGCSLYTLSPAKIFEFTGRPDSVADAPMSSAPDSVVSQSQSQSDDPEILQDLTECSTPTSGTHHQRHTSPVGFSLSSPLTGTETAALLPTTPSAHSQFDKASFLMNIIANSSASTEIRSSAVESIQSNELHATTTDTNTIPSLFPSNEFSSSPSLTLASASVSESPPSPSKSVATPSKTAECSNTPNSAQKARPKRRDSEEAKQAKRERDRLRRARLREMRLAAAKAAAASTSLSHEPEPALAPSTAPASAPVPTANISTDVKPVTGISDLSVEKEKFDVAAKDTSSADSTVPIAAEANTATATATTTTATRSARTLRARKDPPPAPPQPSAPLAVKTSADANQSLRSPGARAVKTEVKLEAMSPAERRGSGTSRRLSHDNPATSLVCSIAYSSYSTVQYCECRVVSCHETAARND